jgi:hypothetical protein
MTCSECSTTDAALFDRGIETMCVPCREAIDVAARKLEVLEGYVDPDDNADPEMTA